MIQSTRRNLPRSTKALLEMRSVQAESSRWTETHHEDDANKKCKILKLEQLGRKPEKARTNGNPHSGATMLRTETQRRGKYEKTTEGKDHIKRWKTTMLGVTKALWPKITHTTASKFKERTGKGSQKERHDPDHSSEQRRDKVSQKKILDRLRENHEDSSKRCY
jgi:hypothetical protein